MSLYRPCQPLHQLREKKQQKTHQTKPNHTNTHLLSLWLIPPRFLLLPHARAASQLVRGAVTPEGPPRQGGGDLTGAGRPLGAAGAISRRPSLPLLCAEWNLVWQNYSQKQNEPAAAIATLQGF